MKRRVLVCGGRNFEDYYFLEKVLDNCLNFFDKDWHLIQGGAIGADTLAKKYCWERGVPCVEVRAAWDYYGKLAGPTRNRWMLNICQPDLIIGFKGGSGTRNMLNLGLTNGVDVYEP